ncbi:ABC transporter permease [Bosea sp. 685]|uniref:ABC transporter permease n=1 Tax=Bosea sp. 685 TaxID=3080057 RepID=UPI002892B5AF|nr:ABC transporter permease subunit [Bosea sp. 685]WNJ93730.1 ABC transporter permease subunit [Bosea sp. 685]
MTTRGMGGGLFAFSYALLFFLFLFGPLIIMVITAFNSSAFPRVVPWECFTTDWFGVLVRNERLMSGLWTSLAIGIAVVAIAVPFGLAGALALADIGPRLRAGLYAVLITPILIPGVVLGISTIVFWSFVGRGVGASYDTVFYNGFFLTLLGQVAFIASYAMLVLNARLQRFDPTLTEAALDLGATPGQAFRKILLPFMKPALGSAAFITFLASFENYNTTVFTILSGNTFTTALASKVRLGTDPSLGACRHHHRGDADRRDGQRGPYPPPGASAQRQGRPVPALRQPALAPADASGRGPRFAPRRDGLHRLVGKPRRRECLPRRDPAGEAASAGKADAGAAQPHPAAGPGAGARPGAIEQPVALRRRVQSKFAGAACPARASRRAAFVEQSLALRWGLQPELACAQAMMGRGSAWSLSSFLRNAPVIPDAAPGSDLRSAQG